MVMACHSSFFKFFLKFIIVNLFYLLHSFMYYTASVAFQERSCPEGRVHPEPGCKMSFFIVSSSSVRSFDSVDSFKVS